MMKRQLWRSKEGLKGAPPVIFVFPQGGEQFTTRKAQLGVQRHPTTRGDGVLVQLAARAPPFLPYLNGRVLIPGHSCLSGRLIPNSPGSSVQQPPSTFSAQQMRPPNIAIWHFVSASSLFPQLLSSLTARCTLVSTCCQFVSVTAADLVLHVPLHRDPLLVRPLVIEVLVTVGLGKRSWFG